MAPKGKAVSVDEIISRYEELGSLRSKDSSPRPKSRKSAAGSTADEPMPELPKSNGHANGHKDEVEGFMCHECVVEAAVQAWQGSEEEAEVLSMESIADIPEDVSAMYDRDASPNSFNRLLQPTATQESRFSVWSTPAPSPATEEESRMPTIVIPPTTMVDTIISPVSTGDRSSTYTPAPQLAHISLMDNLFEQKINIRTLEQYRQALHKFWTTTARLLGPDFDYGYDEVLERIGDHPVDADMPLGVRATTSWPVSPTIKVGSTQRNILGKELFPPLESMGMAWRWFDCESAVQKYINVRLSVGEKWDFGYCFERTDGSQHSMLMRVTGAAAYEQKKTYEDVVDEVKIAEKFGVAGVAPRFWWCRSHPGSKDRDPKRKARDLRCKQRYAEAKRNVEAYKKYDSVPNKFALEASQGNLFQDLEVREMVTGMYSIFTLNTILQLAEITEALGLLDEAENWNRDLVERRVKRMGEKSEHTCYARFKLAQLLMKDSKWDEAKAVAMENITAIAEYDKSHHLYAQQHIQACLIAMKRRRVDAALSVVPYLNLLAQHHPDDLVHREMALEVATEAHTFKRQYDSAIIYLPKLLALYANGYGDKHKQLTYQYELAFAQNRINNCPEAVKTLKECIHLAKELDVSPKSEQFLDIYFLLGQILFEQKEWNPAKFYMEGAARGYREVLGKESEKYLKAKELYLRLEQAMKLKLGLAERLARHHRKQALEAKEKVTPVLEKRKSGLRLFSLIPGAPSGKGEVKS